MYMHILSVFIRYKYDNEKNELVSTFELHEKACRDIEFNDDGTILYSVGKDKAIMLSDFETEKLIRVFENAHQ
jgi:WD40 repeat protein